MIIEAYKYQGAGNDFVILDNRDSKYRLDNSQVKLLCDRRFGIGADGLMLLGKSEKHDFSMTYYNSDGAESTMCGNGGRCLVAFAAHMGLSKFDFEAVDGFHTAQIKDFGKHCCTVRLKMIDVTQWKRYSEKSWYLDTGSPHYVEFVDDVKNYPVEEKGKYWRHHSDFQGGTNVNFVEFISESHLFVRTFERGVEAETFACGTGVTASAIAACLYTGGGREKFDITAPGGELSVDFKYDKKKGLFRDVYLTGPAVFVFKTDIELPEL